MNRRVNLGGLERTRDGNLLVLHRLQALRETSTQIGDSNLWLISLDDADSFITTGVATAADFIFVNGVHVWEKSSLRDGLKNGALTIVEKSKVSWDELFSLGSTKGQLKKSIPMSILYKSIEIWQGTQRSDSKEIFSQSTTRRERIADAALEKYMRTFLGYADV